MNETGKYLTNRQAMPFGGSLDQMLNRMMRTWPFNWPELAPAEEPRALRSFDHVPRVEVTENGKAYSVSIELPGLDEKDIKVEVEDDVLTVSGEKRVEQTDEKTHYSERSYGSFKRAFTLPVDSDTNAITARFAKGVLMLDIGKTAAPRAEVKRVDVKAA
jgi:HSP20 family protein